MNHCPYTVFHKVTTHFRVVCFLLLSPVVLPSFGQHIPPPFLQLSDEKAAWVSRMHASLNTEEKIAQLIMVPVYSNKDQIHIDSISKLVTTHKIGGMIFFQGGPVRQVQMINRYQQESDIPLMISTDGEWGLAMRLDSTVRFPYQMALGAIQDNSLIYAMGKQIAEHTKRVGLQVNFAPVVDVNNNANNPVIGFRSFGEDKENVSQKSLAYMKGMQDSQVLASAKHFPGHGDTNVDSHYGLPVIHFSRKRLEDVELYPFRELIKQGLGSIMVAHMQIPVLDDTPNLASTLSKPIVEGLLKQEMGYEGLVFTDALNMQGVAKFYEPGVVDVKALLAGNDMLLNTMNVPATIREVKKALERGEISIEEIDKRVIKVLKAKAWLGLDAWKPIETSTLIEDLNSPAAKNLSRELAAKSLTVLRNADGILPIKHLGNKKIATLAMGVGEKTQFQEGLERYAAMDHFFLPKEANFGDLQLLKTALDTYDLILIGIHGIQLKAGGTNFGITPEMNLLLKELNATKKTVVSVFGNIYSLASMVDLPQSHGVIGAYQETPDTQDLASQLIFGGIGASGKLPVTVSAQFAAGAGLELSGGVRMAYTLPEAVGIRSQELKGIDSLIEVAIREKAIPGAQVLVAKGGQVIYHKAFGFHTYDSLQEVGLDDIYDLASLTKISTSLAALMYLKGEGKFDENQTLGHYFSMARGTNKEHLKYTDILTHQAGLRSWIPFWQSTVRKSGKFKWFTMKSDSSARFPIKVADNLYIHRKYASRIYREIMESPVDPSQGYVYSDLSFILAPLVVGEITGQPFEGLLRDKMFDPLGAKNLVFNPYNTHAVNNVVETEFDSLFRRQLLHRTVHDEGAAMMGGISGHAGLFGNANDLAKLMHLYLNDGNYGNEQLIREGVVHQYAKCVYCEAGNYRAMGFDRPNRPGDPNGNAAPSAPATSFGHTGFTGTYAWIDPVNDLVYIFLSNRVNPTRENRKLYQLNTRTNVMEVVYQALKSNGLYMKE
jgi:beta-N-acetylhexosaminidase